MPIFRWMYVPSETKVKQCLFNEWTKVKLSLVNGPTNLWGELLQLQWKTYLLLVEKIKDVIYLKLRLL